MQRASPFILDPPLQCSKGIPKGDAEKQVILCANLFRFPLWSSGESGDHTKGPRRFFAYFLTGEKVCVIRHQLK